jgi:hypothetical protein
MRFKSLCSIAGSLLLAAATLLAQEKDLCNQFVDIPTNGGSCFTYVLQGDQRNNVNIQETLSDPSLNPFKYLNIPSCGNVTYDPTTNTTSVTICGAQPIVSGDSFIYGSSSNGKPHFGLDSNGPLNVISGSWSSPANGCSGGSASGGSVAASSVPPKEKQTPVSGRTTQTASGAPASLPFLSLEATKPAGTNPAYYTLFVTGEDLNGNVVGIWCQGLYAAGATPAFQIANFTAEPISITNAGFIVNDVARPLNTLNFGQLPPPGIEGSPFTVPNPPLQGTVLQPNQSIPAPVH